MNMFLPVGNLTVFNGTDSISSLGRIEVAVSAGCDLVSRVHCPEN